MADATSLSKTISLLTKITFFLDLSAMWLKNVWEYLQVTEEKKMKVFKKAKRNAGHQASVPSRPPQQPLAEAAGGYQRSFLPVLVI